MPDSEKLTALNQRNATPINARVPISLHPDSIANFGQTLVDGESAGASIDGYSAGRSALAALYTSMTQIDAAHASMTVMAPVVGAMLAQGSKPIYAPMIPVEQRPALANAMATSASRAGAQVEANIAVVDKTISKVEGYIKARTTASVEPVEAQAIRQYVKDLPAEQRMSFLHKMCEAKDLPTVSAVLNSIPFVSGLDREQHGILRSLADDAFAPAETKQRHALGLIRNQITVALGSYAQEFHKRLPKVVESGSDKAMATLKMGAAA